PSWRGDGRRDQPPEFFVGLRRPLRPPKQLVELRVRIAEGLRQPPCENRFSAAARTDDHDASRRKRLRYRTAARHAESGDRFAAGFIAARPVEGQGSEAAGCRHARQTDRSRAFLQRSQQRLAHAAKPRARRDVKETDLAVRFQHAEPADRAVLSRYDGVAIIGADPAQGVLDRLVFEPRAERRWIVAMLVSE